MIYKCKSAVFFHIWNRIDVVKRVFKQIKASRPPKLYLSSDGPRNPKDKEKIRKIRNYIVSGVNWKCKLIKIYQKKNLGAKYALVTNLTKAFKNEKKLIILDHDCLPDNSFFRFCDELLEIYKKKNKVKIITGNYICKNLIRKKYSYYFGYHPLVFGWATWKRTWKEYDIKMKDFQPIKSFFWLLYFFNLNIVKTMYFYNKFKLSKNNQIDTWDYQLVYSIWKNKGLILKPTVNLSKHIGWGKQAYHGSTHDDDLKDIKVRKINFPLKHPKSISINREADEIEYKRIRKLYFFKSLIYFISLKFKNFTRETS
tara:strand:- start:135 stop:1070 length:936 start_codon:yes stop_codon:yes gene_type:complete